MLQTPVLSLLGQCNRQYTYHHEHGSNNCHHAPKGAVVAKPAVHVVLLYKKRLPPLHHIGVVQVA